MIRITKIYSFLYVRLWRYHQKVTERSSAVKLSTMFDFHELHVKLFLLTCIQKYILLCYLESQFWNNFEFLELDRDCSGKSAHVHNCDYWFQKINNSHDLKNLHIWPSPQCKYSYLVRFQFYFVFGSNKNFITLNAHNSKLVLWHMSTFPLQSSIVKSL